MNARIITENFAAINYGLMIFKFISTDASSYWGTMLFGAMLCFFLLVSETNQLCCV